MIREGFKSHFFLVIQLFNEDLFFSSVLGEAGLPGTPGKDGAHGEKGQKGQRRSTSIS